VSRIDKQKILDEFAEVTGFHRKHAIRVLRQKSAQGSTRRPSPCVDCSGDYEFFGRLQNFAVAALLLLGYFA